MAEAPNNDNELISDLERAVERVETFAKDNLKALDEEMLAQNPDAGGSSEITIHNNLLIEKDGVEGDSIPDEFADATPESDILINSRDTELANSLDIEFELDPGQDAIENGEYIGLAADYDDEHSIEIEDEILEPGLNDTLQELQGIDDTLPGSVDSPDDVENAQAFESFDGPDRENSDSPDQLKKDWNVLYPDESKTGVETSVAGDADDYDLVISNTDDGENSDEPVQESSQPPIDREISLKEPATSLDDDHDDDNEPGTKFAASIIKIQESRSDSNSSDQTFFSKTEKDTETGKSNHAGTSDSVFTKHSRFLWIAYFLLFALVAGFGYWQYNSLQALYALVANSKTTNENTDNISSQQPQISSKAFDEISQRTNTLTDKVDHLNGVVLHLNQTLKAKLTDDEGVDLSGSEELRKIFETLALLEKRIDGLDTSRKIEPIESKVLGSDSKKSPATPDQSLSQQGKSKIEQLYRDASNERSSKPVAARQWVVNLASARKKRTIEKIKADFENKGISVEQVRVLVKDKPWYRLQVSGFANKADAEQFGQHAKSKLGLESFWIGR